MQTQKLHVVKLRSFEPPNFSFTSCGEEITLVAFASRNNAEKYIRLFAIGILNDLFDCQIDRIEDLNDPDLSVSFGDQVYCTISFSDNTVAIFSIEETDLPNK